MMICNLCGCPIADHGPARIYEAKLEYCLIAWDVKRERERDEP